MCPLLLPQWCWTISSKEKGFLENIFVVLNQNKSEKENSTSFFGFFGNIFDFSSSQTSSNKSQALHSNGSSLLRFGCVSKPVRKALRGNQNPGKWRGYCFSRSHNALNIETKEDNGPACMVKGSFAYGEKMWFGWLFFIKSSSTEVSAVCKGCNLFFTSWEEFLITQNYSNVIPSDNLLYVYTYMNK